MKVEAGGAGSSHVFFIPTEKLCYLGTFACGGTEFFMGDLWRVTVA